LNWLCRYVPLKGLLVEAGHSLLEVGSGHRGVGCVRPLPFVGAEIAFSQPPVAPMVGVQYDGSLLPFKTGAFHTVLSVDAYEHVPPAHRRNFLRELIRVAANRVVLSFPADEAIDSDRYLQALYRRFSLGEPEWLREHEELGIPRSSDAEAELAALTGWRWRPMPTTGNLVNLLLLLADILPGTDAWVRPILEDHREDLERLILAGSFGPASRKVYLLEREGLTDPLVDLTEPGSLVAALSCPACGGDLEDGVRLACLGCGRDFSPDPRGVLPLVAPEGSVPALLPPLPPEVPAPAAEERPAVVFALAPDWLETLDWVAPVHNYLKAFPPEAPCLLRLKADPARIDAEEAICLLAPILEAYEEGRFPEIELTADFEDPALQAATTLLPATADELAAWTPGRFQEVFRAARKEARP
jgi:hypothetical protein